MLVSAVALCFISPEAFLSAMTDGAGKAVTLSLTLIAIYCVWSGLYQIAESAAITPKIARFLKKPLRVIFGGTDEKCEEFIAMSVAANMIGIGGIATPLGINAAEGLQKNNKFFAFTMLLVVASTSLQLLPASVIALRGSLGSASPSSIILPALLSTLVSSVSGILLTKIFVRR